MGLSEQVGYAGAQAGRGALGQIEDRSVGNSGHTGQVRFGVPGLV